MDPFKNNIFGGVKQVKIDDYGTPGIMVDSFSRSQPPFPLNFYTEIIYSTYVEISVEKRFSVCHRLCHWILIHPAITLSSAYFKSRTTIWNSQHDHIEYADIMQAIKTVRLTSTAKSRFIIFSDAHYCDGIGADDFAANSLLFNCALDYYYDQGFPLIELGDSEDLWENKRFPQIYITHTSVYGRLTKFHDSDPEKTCYIKICGNHDDCRKNRCRAWHCAEALPCNCVCWKRQRHKR